MPGKKFGLKESTEAATKSRDDVKEDATDYTTPVKPPKDSEGEAALDHGNAAPLDRSGNVGGGGEHEESEQKDMWAPENYDNVVKEWQTMHNTARTAMLPVPLDETALLAAAEKASEAFAQALIESCLDAGDAAAHDISAALPHLQKLMALNDANPTAYNSWCGCKELPGGETLREKNFVQDFMVCTLRKGVESLGWQVLDTHASGGGVDLVLFLPPSEATEGQAICIELKHAGTTTRGGKAKLKFEFNPGGSWEQQPSASAQESLPAASKIVAWGQGFTAMKWAWFTKGFPLSSKFVSIITASSSPREFAVHAGCIMKHDVHLETVREAAHTCYTDVAARITHTWKADKSAGVIGSPDWDKKVSPAPPDTAKGAIEAAQQLLKKAVSHLP